MIKAKVSIHYLFKLFHLSVCLLASLESLIVSPFEVKNRFKDLKSKIAFGFFGPMTLLLKEKEMRALGTKNRVLSPAAGFLHCRMISSSELIY